LRADLGGVDRATRSPGSGWRFSPRRKRGAAAARAYTSPTSTPKAWPRKKVCAARRNLEVGGQAVNDSADLSSALDAARKEGHRSVLLRVKSAEGTRFVALPVAAS